MYVCVVCSNIHENAINMHNVETKNKFDRVQETHIFILAHVKLKKTERPTKSEKKIKI